MYRKSAYNRKYRKRKAKALRLCRRGETEREVKRMIRYIVKRSGDKVSFDARKIKSAIFKANTRIAAERMSDADLNELTEDVLTALEKLPGTPTAQKIQNVVEEKLLAADYAKTANAYINYRTEHEHLREMDDELVKIFENLTFRPSEEDDLKRENANINADTAMGTMLKYGSESAKAFYDKYVIPPEIAEAHANGDIHIHDKDFYASKAVSRRIFHRPRLFERAERHPQLRRARVHCHSGKPKRDARRPKRAEFRLRYGGGREENIPQAVFPCACAVY